jgi:hypothetical protein
MEQYLASESDSGSDGEEIGSLLGPQNPKIHYCVHKSPPLNLTLLYTAYIVPKSPCETNVLCTVHRPRENPYWEFDICHDHDFKMSDESVLAILKAFLPQQVNKQQTIGFTCLVHSTSLNHLRFNLEYQNTDRTVKVHSLHATLNCLMFSVCT